MGLLKHAILPLFTLFDSFLMYGCLIKEKIDDKLKQDWDYPIDKPMDPLSIHLMHLTGGVASLLVINNIAAIFYGNGFHRALAVAQHGIFFVVDAWSYIKTGRKIPGIIYGINVVVGIALVIHSQEPGIFTTDKFKEE